jgi:hypothetical protein
MLMFYIASRFQCIKNNGLGSVGLFATVLIDRLLWNRYSFPPRALALPLLSLLRPFGGVVRWTITVVAYLPFVAGRALSRLCSPSLFGCSISALVFGRHDDGVSKLNLLCQFFSSHLVCGPPPPPPHMQNPSHCPHSRCGAAPTDSDGELVQPRHQVCGLSANVSPLAPFPSFLPLTLQLFWIHAQADKPQCQLHLQPRPSCTPIHAHQFPVRRVAPILQVQLTPPCIRFGTHHCTH